MSVPEEGAAQTRPKGQGRKLVLVGLLLLGGTRLLRGGLLRLRLRLLSLLLGGFLGRRFLFRRGFGLGFRLFLYLLLLFNFLLGVLLLLLLRGLFSLHYLLVGELLPSHVVPVLHPASFHL